MYRCHLNVEVFNLPSRGYYFNAQLKDKRVLYRKHLENVFKIINQNTKYKLDPNFVDNVLKFDFELAKYTMKPKQLRQYNKYFTLTTLTDLYNNINSLVSLPDKNENYNEDEQIITITKEEIQLIEFLMEKIYKLFNFRAMMEDNFNVTYLSDDNKYKKPNKHQIITLDGDQIRRVLRFILNQSNLQKYRSFLQYKIIKKFRTFAPKILNDEFFDFYKKKLKGQINQKTNEKKTIIRINHLIGEIAGKLYVEKYFNLERKKKIENMINNIISTLNNSISNNNWMSESTKNNALDKLSKFTIKVGFPDYWKDYSKLDINSNDNYYIILQKIHKWSLNKDVYNKNKYNS